MSGRPGLAGQRGLIEDRATGADGDYNQHTISVVNGTGFPVGWTVDSLGWKGTSGGITTARVLNRVLGSLQLGEIVLMHCGSNPEDHSTLNADALPAVIRAPLTGWFP